MEVLAILFVNVLAAFCAALKTDEKNPPCWATPGVVEPFSSVGVSGALMIFESLLGPSADDVDLTRRCDIMLPEGETTISIRGGTTGSEMPRSRAVGNRAAVSVGVGGVFVIKGADLSPGGVRGVVVLIGCGVLPVRARSGEDDAESGVVCLSGNIAPILDATLPRRPSTPPELLSLKLPPNPPALRSGLVLGLFPLRGLNAAASRPAGDGDLLAGSPAAATSVVEELEADTVFGRRGNVEAFGVLSTCASGTTASGSVNAFTRGDDVVR